MIVNMPVDSFVRIFVYKTHNIIVITHMQKSKDVRVFKRSDDGNDNQVVTQKGVHAEKGVKCHQITSRYRVSDDGTKMIHFLDKNLRLSVPIHFIRSPTIRFVAISPSLVVRYF